MKTPKKFPSFKIRISPKKIRTQWKRANLSHHSAALSFFTMFSLSPFLVLVLVFSNYVHGPEAAAGTLVGKIESFTGKTVALFIQNTINDTYVSDAVIPVTIASIFVMVSLASAVFIQLKESLNIIFGVELKTHPIHAYVKKRIFAVLLIMGLGVLLVGSFYLNIAQEVTGSWMNSHIPYISSIGTLLDVIISLAGMSIIFGSIFKLIPNIKLRWRYAWIGAAITSILFFIGKTLIGLLLNNRTVWASFEASGSLFFIMLWIYYSSIIFFIGAMVTRFVTEKLSPENKIIPDDDAVSV